MRYQVIRSRKQIQIIEVDADTGSAALRRAELNVKDFRSLADSGDEWTYEVRPIQ